MTPAWQRRIDADPTIVNRLVRWYPLGRLGNPDDVASAALFLCSVEASWISGTTLLVDGGLLAGHPRMIEDILPSMPLS